MAAPVGAGENDVDAARHDHRHEFYPVVHARGRCTGLDVAVSNIGPVKYFMVWWSMVMFTKIALMPFALGFVLGVTLFR